MSAAGNQLAGNGTACAELPFSPGCDPVLLLDEHVVADTVGLRQEFYAATKSPLNPVIIKTEPWEGDGPYLWGNRLLRNPETGEYQLWYAAFRHADNHYRWGYAVSSDGLRWEKPPLCVETFEGQPARNMLAGGPHPHKALRTLACDPRPDCDPARRFKAIRFTYEGEYASFSADGIHWTEHAGNPVWKVPSDIIHTMWDPNRNTFVAYFKLWEITGEEVDVTRPGWTRPFHAFVPFLDWAERGDRVDCVGPAVRFQPGGGAMVQEGARFSLHSGGQGWDDGGGGMLRGQWTMKRLICWAESDDFIHWRNERPMLRADDRDDPTANIQYLFVFLYGGYYLGVLTMHEESGHFNQQLAFSHDGLHWQRPWRDNFISVGPAGAWDSGMILGPVDPILFDDEMRFYYGGFDGLHHWSGAFHSAIGFASLRPAGFAAWLPQDESGTLLTQPFHCPSGRLTVNADARDGLVQVEVTDKAGQPIPGFEREACRGISTDAVAAETVWNSAVSLAALGGKKIRLRFFLNWARLFAFRFD